jgi:hypothetical protein
MSQNATATATAPVVEATSLQAMASGAIKAISRDHFPTTQDIADHAISKGFPVPDGKGPAYVASRVASLVESGTLDEELAKAARQSRPAVRRKPIHDKKGHVKAEDKLGRKGHRELRHGLILRNDKGWRVCGRTTKDLTDAQRLALFQMRNKGASWRKISNHPSLMLEYNHGMTARNLFLAEQRAKQRAKKS